MELTPNTPVWLALAISSKCLTGYDRGFPGTLDSDSALNSVSAGEFLPAFYVLVFGISQGPNLSIDLTEIKDSKYTSLVWLTRPRR